MTFLIAAITSPSQAYFGQMPEMELLLEIKVFLHGLFACFESEISFKLRKILV